VHTPVPASAPPRGRYSSQPADEIVVPSAPPTSIKATLRGTPGKDTLRRSQRQSIREDDVGSTRIVARKEALRPAIVDPKRLAKAPLGPREAFLLSLIDGTLTVPDLVDAAGMPSAEVTAILERLVRLGIVSFSG
jgi:hypothetical protein